MPFAYKVVLKRRFYYYSGIVRPTDQEITATEKRVCYSQLQRRGGMPHHEVPLGEAPRRFRKQREGKEM